jgi:hypothetical protein
MPAVWRAIRTMIGLLLMKGGFGRAQRGPTLVACAVVLWASLSSRMEL